MMAHSTMRALGRISRSTSSAQKVLARSLGSYAEQPEYQLFAGPNENIKLNWSLVDDDITPMGDSFRNLSAKGLVQRASGSLGENKSLVVAPGVAPSGGADRSAVAHQLSMVDDVFVVDAAVGSFRGSQVLVRAVTDDAAVALFFKHLLVPIGGINDETSGGSNPIKVFHSSTGNAGISTSQTENTATIVASGNVAFSALQEAVTSATHHLMAQGEEEFNILPIAGNVLVDGSGKTVIEIDANEGGSATIANAPSKKQSLYGAHGAVWSGSGIARLFGGAVVASKAAGALGSPAVGDLVVGDNIVTSFPGDNLISHPSKIVIKGAGKGGAAEKFAKVARSDEEVEKFTAFVEQHGVKVE